MSVMPGNELYKNLGAGKLPISAKSGLITDYKLQITRDPGDPNARNALVLGSCNLYS